MGGGTDGRVAGGVGKGLPHPVADDCGGLGAGSPPERARPVRLLCARPVLVAVVLRGGGRARNPTATAMRRAPLFVRGARAVAAIRKRLPRILSGAGAAARPQYRFLDARPDAGAAAHFP